MTALKRFFQESDLVFYLAFLWQLPFSWRFILIESRGIREGQFNEYMDISLYIGELLLIFSATLYILNNIYLIKSIYSKILYKIQNVFHVEQLVFFSVALYFALNIGLSIDPVLSLTFTWHALSALLFFFLTYGYIVSRGTCFLKNVLVVFIVSIILQLVIAGYQVLSGHGLGLSFLNESKISIDSINVAKSEIFGQKMLRGYGTFPHPNILAAYVLVVYAFFLQCRKLFHVEQKGALFAGGITLLLVVLTGSKIGILLFFVIYFSNQIRNLFHVKQIVLLSIILSLSLVWIYQNDLQKSLSTRVEQLNYQSKFNQSTFFGTGLGTYRYSYEREGESREWWVLEPVHNVPYITYKEMGIVGFGLLVLAIISLFRIVPRGTISGSSVPIVVLVLYLNTDHFLWDIEQGMYLVALLVIVQIISIDKTTISKYNKKHYSFSV